MHRAKHRAGRTGADSVVLASDLLERFAVVPGPRAASSGARHGAVAVAPAAVGVGLFGALPYTSPMLVVPTDDDRAPEAAALFGGAEAGEESPLFGAARHARPRAVPAPRTPDAAPRPPRAQPVGTALSATVLGAAAAVTAVVVPVPTGVETTGSLAPVQTAPAPAVTPLGPALAAPAPVALPDQPTMQIHDLVSGVRAEMQKAAVPTVSTPFATVANTTSISPAATRKAAMTNALSKLGTPYRWGAMGPNAFDCSGLVKWSFANVGRALPRTSRAMASVGTPVSRANLQPGDLVFFYQPISHVGIYIGNNKIVHASQSGQPVKISDITRMRFTTARRV